MTHKYIEIRKASDKKGRGAFAIRDIKKGTIVEKGHILLIPNEDYNKIYDTILYNYSFHWNDPRYDGEYENVVPMSLCNFINHSYSPNTKYLYDYDNLFIKFIALRDIKKGEEITTNYNAEPEDKSPVWFDVEDE